MKERPILMSAPMVRALLAGSKTQTRRIVKLPHQNPLGVWEALPWGGPKGGRLRDGSTVPAQMVIGHSRTGDVIGCPYGQPGDRLWVREAHSIYPTHGQHRADGERWGPWGGLPTTVSADGKQIAYYREGFDRCDPGRWRPSIHMPRWASRILLEIVSVRVERLQDISEADALAEGIQEIIDAGVDHDGYPRDAYRSLWEQINGHGSWALNPWVWAVEFIRIAA